MCYEWKRLVYKCERPNEFGLKPCHHYPEYRPERRCERSPATGPLLCSPPPGTETPETKEPACKHPGPCCGKLLDDALHKWMDNRAYLKERKEKTRDYPIDLPEADDTSVEYGRWVEVTFKEHKGSCKPGFNLNIADIDKKRHQAFHDLKLNEGKGKQVAWRRFTWLW